MSHCLNPDCLQVNPNNAQFCQKCGDKLLLRKRYRAKRILGQGGFGRTFLAVDEDKPSKPFCVIKQFLPQAQGNIQKAAELFAQEAQRLEELGKHPQIPELFAYFTSEGRQYLVQEFIDGETLQSELEKNGVFNESQIRELLQDLLTVLQFVHNNQVIHRDIKPENIIRRNIDKKLVLVDFGAAKYVEPIQRTVTGTVIGSAEYCAPEQSMGKPTFSSDLYSLGVTCLHLLTQINPFELYDVMEAEWVWRDFLNGNSVSNNLGNICDRLIERVPKKRYQSAREVLENLRFNTLTTPKIFNSNSTPYILQPFSQGKKSKLHKTHTKKSFQEFSLVSSVNINYKKLKRLLERKKWRKADCETRILMLKIAGGRSKQWLDAEDIEKFPCEDLQTINKLWVTYSQGKFGFSVQKEIYKMLNKTMQYNEETWEEFGSIVGWRVNEKWVYYNELNFDLLQAPRGHLPIGLRWLRLGHTIWGGVYKLGTWRNL